MANRLVDLWRTRRSIYGVDELHAAARRAGIDIGGDQVARLMRIAGIAGVTRGKRKTVTTKGDPAAARHPDLRKRQWDTPVRPEQWWVADFTYVWTLVGFVSVSFVTDVFCRRIVGWRVTSTKTTPLVLSALEQASFCRRRTNVAFTAAGTVFHCDYAELGIKPRNRVLTCSGGAF
jgi:transposase InsO family protein